MNTEQWSLANMRAYGWLWLLTLAALVATVLLCLVP
jgi:hypothetical protein